MGMTTYLETQILGALKNTLNFYVSKLYLALFTTPPTDASPGTEISDSSYSRQTITLSAVGKQGDCSVCSNVDTLMYGEATTNWGSVTHFGIFDEATGGHMLLTGKLKEPLRIYPGDTVIVSANQLAIKLG